MVCGLEIILIVAGNMAKNSKFSKKILIFKVFNNRVERLRELVMECYDKLYDSVEKAQQEKIMMAGRKS